MLCKDCKCVQLFGQTILQACCNCSVLYIGNDKNKFKWYLATPYNRMEWAWNSQNYFFQPNELWLIKDCRISIVNSLPILLPSIQISLREADMCTSIPFRKMFVIVKLFFVCTQPQNKNAAIFFPAIYHKELPAGDNVGNDVLHFPLLLFWYSGSENILSNLRLSLVKVFFELHRLQIWHL